MVFPPFITTHSLGVEVQTDGDVLLRQEGVGEVFQEVLWQRGLLKSSRRSFGREVMKSSRRSFSREVSEVFQEVLRQRGL